MITKNEIKDVLLKSGIKYSDRLLVHSSLRKIGPISGGGDTLIDAILEIIGKDGLLAMPSFNYTTDIPQPYFDVKNTPGKTGILTELFRKREGVLRSLSPTHSVTIIGQDAKKIIEGHLDCESLGINSPIDHLSKLGGYVLLLGVTHTSNSTIHIGEAYAKVKKFFYKPGDLPIAKILMPDRTILEKQIDCSGSCGRSFNAIEMMLRKKGSIRDLDIGNAPAYLIKGTDIIETVVEMVSQQPDILFCTRPTCRRCLLGREFALFGKITSEI